MKKKIIFWTIIWVIILIIATILLFWKTGITFIDNKICYSIIQSKYSVPVVVAKNKKVDTFFVSDLNSRLKSQYAWDWKICSYQEFDKIANEIDKDWEKTFWWWN